MPKVNRMKEFLNKYKFIALAGLFCILQLASSLIYAQDASKIPERGHIGTNPSDLPPPFPIAERADFRLLPLPDCLPQMDSVWMEFSIDWTSCQIHRVDDTPIEIILPGTIDGSNTLYWNLSTVSSQPGAPPDLYFIEDVLGRTGPAYGSDIPLTWEISLDGGPFTPMTFQPDNTLTTTFPPGAHTFQVRITGELQPYQGDGYYHLQLEQCLVPEL